MNDMTDVTPLTDHELEIMVGSHRTGCICIFCACAARIKQDGARIATCRTALEQYGHHNNDCAANYHDPCDCDCGLGAALARLEAERC